jgi:outer membrane protein assembly factor BamB
MTVALWAADSKPASWPQFRGPNGTAVGEDSASFPTEFGPGKALLWKADLPIGHGSPCVWGDRIFVTASDPAKKTLELFALNRRDGKLLWHNVRQAAELEKVHATSSPATSTPATDGERIYVYFGSIGLFAVTMNGEPAWEYPMEAAKSPYGSGISPVIAGDLVIITRDYPPEPYMIAVNRKDGKLAWKVALPKGNQPGPNTSHATPLIWRDQILLHRAGEVAAYSPKDGSRLWWVQTPGSGTGALAFTADSIIVPAYNTIGDPASAVDPTPFAKALEKYDADKDGKLSAAETPGDDLYIRRRPGVPDSVPGAHFTFKVFFGFIDSNKDGFLDESEYNGIFEMIKKMSAPKAGVVSVRPNGEGDQTLSAITWTEPRNVPEVPAPLFYRDRVYTISNGGIVSCMDAKIGKLLFRGRVNAPGAYYSSPVAAGGRVVVASAEGMVTVLGGGESLEVLANNDLGEPVFGTPAPIESALYVRSLNHLWAFGNE